MAGKLPLTEKAERDSVLCVNDSAVSDTALISPAY